jgi:hypothetical protein
LCYLLPRTVACGGRHGKENVRLLSAPPVTHTSVKELAMIIKSNFFAQVETLISIHCKVTDVYTMAFLIRSHIIELFKWRIIVVTKLVPQLVKVAKKVVSRVAIV